MKRELLAFIVLAVKCDLTAIDGFTVRLILSSSAPLLRSCLVATLAEYPLSLWADILPGSLRS